MTHRFEIPFPPRHEPPARGRPDQLFVPVTARWEYREIVCVDGALPGEQALNALGDEGRERAAVVPGGGQVRFYFKRERST